MSADRGAYRLFIHLSRPAWVRAGRLGRFRLEPGDYVYVGSARRALAGRVARHRRVAMGGGGGHWHIDGLLGHRFARLVKAETWPDAEECALSHALAAEPGTTVPVPRFGATDCTSGCRAHLYRLESPSPEAL